MDTRLLAQWWQMIEELGGEWVGVQEGFSSEMDPTFTYEPMAVFYAPKSRKPIYLAVSKMTRGNVMNAMGIADKAPESDTVGHLEHAAKRLRNLAQQLTLTADEIKEEIKCLKKS
jgi:hypothetical protein